MKRNPSGFTLVELAIVLVIIGLALGGLLKLQEAINGVKVRNFAGDFKNAKASVHGYQDKYKVLPGDDPNVGAHLGAASGAVQATTPTASFGVPCMPPPGLAGCVGNGVIDGAWNSTTPTDESFLVWQHVRMARLDTGPAAISDPGYLPTNGSGGIIGVQGGTSNLAYTPVKDKNGVAIRGAYIICSAGIPGKYVKQLDAQMDDGDTDSGAMLATPTAGYHAGAAASAAIDDAVAYTVCLGV